MVAFKKYELFLKPSKVGEGRYGEYTVTSPDDVYNVSKALGIAMRPVEKVYALYMDAAGNLIGVTEVSSGGVSSSIVDAKVVFSPALVLGNVTNLILCHNHPSGRLEPSKEDVLLTKKLIEAGKLLDINVADHVIVSANGYSSIKEATLK